MDDERKDLEEAQDEEPQDAGPVGGRDPTPPAVM
jgi:hypothetical protein